nr:hypothetical protein [Myxococcus sp. AM009]
MADMIEARFDPGTSKASHSVEWLSDDSPIYAAKNTRDFGFRLGLRVCTKLAYLTPAQRHGRVIREALQTRLLLRQQTVLDRTPPRPTARLV